MRNQHCDLLGSFGDPKSWCNLLEGSQVPDCCERTGFQKLERTCVPHFLAVFNFVESIPH